MVFPGGVWVPWWGLGAQEQSSPPTRERCGVTAGFSSLSPVVHHCWGATGGCLSCTWCPSQVGAGELSRS